MITLYHVLGAALKDLGAARQLREALRNDLVVADPFLRAIGTFLGDFITEHQKLPQEGDWAIWLSGLPAGQKDGAQSALHSVRTTDVSSFTMEYLAKEAFQELRRLATQTAVSRLATAGPKADQELLRDYADRVAKIQPISLVGLADLHDVDVWITPEMLEGLIPTGFRRVDSYLGGGLARGELSMIMADSGIGKTTWLANVAGTAALTGSKVLTLSMELSSRNTLHRHYRRMASSTRAEFRENINAVKARVGHALRYLKGSIHVLFEEAYTLTPEALRILTEQFIQEHDGLDLLVVDYLDLMAPPSDASRLSEYQTLGRITHLTRNLAAEMDCSVLTATQSVRGMGDSPRLDHMGDSYNKVRGSDNIFALAQSPEEANANQARICFLKVREAPGRGQEVPIYVNMDLMLMADLDHPSTRRIMERFGHTPTQQREDGEGRAAESSD